MRKTPRWMKSVLDEAAKPAPKMPYARDTRRPSWQRDADKAQKTVRLKSA